MFVPARAGQTGDDVRAKRPPAGDGNGGWKQKEKVPKTLDFIGFSALWMAHPEELESTAYCLGGSRSILLSYGCMYAVLRSRPNRQKRTLLVLLGGGPSILVRYGGMHFYGVLKSGDGLPSRV